MCQRESWTCATVGAKSGHVHLGGTSYAPYRPQRSRNVLSSTSYSGAISA